MPIDGCIPVTFVYQPVEPELPRRMYDLDVMEGWTVVNSYVQALNIYESAWGNKKKKKTDKPERKRNGFSSFIHEKGL